MIFSFSHCVECISLIDKLYCSQENIEKLNIKTKDLRHKHGIESKISGIFVIFREFKKKRNYIGEFNKSALMEIRVTY